MQDVISHRLNFFLVAFVRSPILSVMGGLYLMAYATQSGKFEIEV